MLLKSFSFMTALNFLIFLIVISLTLNHSLADLSELSNDISVNCGSSSIFNGNNGRKWIGDIGTKLLVTSQDSESKSLRSKLSQFSDTIPYSTARISYKQFSYEIDVGLGQKFIRMYFYPTMYKGFGRSNDFFTVKAGPFTLLSNFSASLTVDAFGVKYLMKEFCINVEKHRLLTITFSPSTVGAIGKAYAFVNGIEIISMPSSLYYTPVDEPAMQVVGKKYQLSVDESIALEMVYRLNIGGISISSAEDTGLFREWSDDVSYLVNSNVRPVSTSNRIKYKSIASYTAPQKVYQTSWATVLTEQVDKVDNFTWKLPLDLGFRYLIRFHFCELEYDIKENSHLRFSILINNQVAEANVDLIKWSGGSGIAISRDYMAVMKGDRMEGKRDLLISLTPKWSNNEEWWTKSSDTILKGLEVFKLSNTDNNLAGVNPIPLTQALSSSIRNPRKFVYAKGGSSISTTLIILISLLCIIVYELRVMGEKYGDDKISISPSKGVSRRFSLAEIRTATNNFDKTLVIGRGGFGLVYKGVISGTVTVALKRLNFKSNQGGNEFWTEIDMLSKLRHTHLVSLIGYCDEGGEMILVYEFMEHGTLADHLYKIGSNRGDNLDLLWEQKLKICIGAARGLDYLHTGTQHGVIHRDVKPTNILLDNKLVAKISDFGLCKGGPTSHSYTHLSTNVKGTFGYFDPEYFLTNRLTKKSDVYAFGVVLLEVLSGRRAVDISLGEDRCSLALWAQQCIKEGKFNELIGPSLRGQISPSCLKEFTEVAYKCLHNRAIGRPTMFDVVVSLEGALTFQNHMFDIVQMNGALQQGKQILPKLIQLADQIIKSADEASSFKAECAELKSKTEKLAALLRQAARASNDLYERPTRRIIDDTQQVLEKALALVHKCSANGVMKRVFTIIPAAAFRKASALLENSVGDVSWLLRVSGSAADRGGEYLGLPPFAVNEPVLCLIWEQIAVLSTGSAEDRSDSAASLVSLARHGDRYGKLIIEEGGVGPLLKLLKDGKIDGQENAAKAIGLLGKDPASIEHMIHVGVCSLFAKILKEGPMKVQAVVAWAVSELAAHHPKCQDLFAQNNIIRLLVSHLAFETVQEHNSNKPSTTATIGNKVNNVNSEDDDPMGQSKIIHPLGNRQPSLMHNVVASAMTTENKPIQKSNGTPIMDQSSVKQSNLLNHHKSSHTRSSSITNGREFEDPVTKSYMKAMAARALGKLSKNNSPICKSITEYRALLCFAVLLEKGTDDVKYNSAMALMEITAVAEKDADLRRSAFKPNLPGCKAVFDQLFKIIDNPDSELLIPCIKAIGHLGRTFKATETRMISPLVRLLDERDSEVSREACVSLSKFACSKNYFCIDHSKAIIEAGGVERLIQLVHFGEQIVQCPALVLLCYISMHVPDSEGLAEAKVLTVLEWASKQAHLVQDENVKILLQDRKRRLELYQSRGSRGFH